MIIVQYKALHNQVKRTKILCLLQPLYGSQSGYRTTATVYVRKLILVRQQIQNMWRKTFELVCTITEVGEA